MSLAEIHARLGNTVLFYVAIMGLWGLWRFIRKQGIDSNYWGALVIAEVVIVLQGALGAYLWISGARPGRLIHLLYGIVSALVIPGVYSYTKGDDKRQATLVYGVALLVTVGLVLRAIMTAQGS